MASDAAALVSEAQRLADRFVVANDARHAAVARQFFAQQLVLGREPPLLERAADDQPQVLGVDGLGEKIERAFAHGANGVRHGRRRR